MASPMDSQVADLVDKTWKKFQSLDISRRLLIAISGIPGSGKTTLASQLVHGLNTLHHTHQHTLHPNFPAVDDAHTDPSQPDIAFVIPLDGYHLTRKQLAAMPNAEEAIFRRGAAFTFDSQSYLGLVQKLRQPIEAGTRTIHAPSFDHAVKDPVANDIPIPKTGRIVVFEGLYTALDRAGWRDAAEVMDELWFVECDIGTAEQRVAKRNFVAGISASLEESLKRTRESDMRNAREILAERLEVQQVVRSVEDESWKSEEVKEEEERAKEDEGRRDLGEQLERMGSIAEMTSEGVGW